MATGETEPQAANDSTVAQAANPDVSLRRPGLGDPLGQWWDRRLFGVNGA